MDPTLKGELVPLLAALLVDKVPAVFASALSAWEQICPERTDLLHPAYRQICRMLIEMDEWGQLVAMRVLAIYVRRCFEKPEEKTEQENNNPDQFYDDNDNSNHASSLDPDLELLYKCALQLVHSRSSAVLLIMCI
jgi:AP-3 complex subunit beta